MKREKKEIQTKHIALTFAYSILPQSVDNGYTKMNLRPYVPNPRGCYEFPTIRSRLAKLTGPRQLRKMCLP